MPAVDVLDWSTAKAAALRALPASKTFCQCAGAEDCDGAPSPPVTTASIVYRLAHDRLNPTADSRKPLAQIAAQWGHHAGLEAWNLSMRGF